MARPGGRVPAPRAATAQGTGEATGPAICNSGSNAGQHTKEGRYARKWTRPSGMRFAANAVRRQLHTLPATSPASSRTLATPETIERWSLAFLRERLTKTATRLVAHGRYAIFQMAASALPREVFAEILGLINAFRDSPAIALSACLAAREPQSALLATRQMRLKTGKMTPQRLRQPNWSPFAGEAQHPQRLETGNA
ncbi:MAG: hypothetical protein GY717_17505 [Rhodobacteraceae bacterium]|nr:hypothetical protein [Paracoccaceae bacterium]